MTKKTTNVRIFKCGKCEDGEIVTTYKFGGESTELNINKCSNPKCKYQYYIKELLVAKLEIILRTLN